MIYFVLVASVLAVQDGAVLELTGEAPKVEFGGALTLIHNATEDQLTCSGKIQASDVLIEGTSTTVADLIQVPGGGNFEAGDGGCAARGDDSCAAICGDAATINSAGFTSSTAIQCYWDRRLSRC